MYLFCLSITHNVCFYFLPDKIRHVLRVQAETKSAPERALFINVRRTETIRRNMPDVFSVELEETDLNLRNLLIIYIFSNYCFPIGLRF